MLLDRLESIVESVVEGAFGLILRGKIQPLEVARRLTREAEEQKIITLNRVFVPNRFVVGLHPRDMATLQPIAQELQAEFQRFVGEWVIDRDYAVTGPIQVTLTSQDKVGRGRMRIQGSLDDVRLAEEAARKGFGFDLQLVPEENVGRLQVEKGPDANRTFTLLARPMLLGRGMDCDIRLQDPAIPPRYARIEPDGNSWRLEELEDLGGGPSLLINDEEEHDGRLRDGDTVRIGRNVFRFRLAESVVRDPVHAD